MPQPPQDYKTTGIFMLVSGILSILASLAFIASLIWICVGAFWVLTLAAGIFEVIVGAAAMSGKYQANAKTVSIIGIVGGILCGNIVGAVLEVLAMVNLGKPEVMAWMSDQAAGLGAAPLAPTDQI
jgi:hypothetical protein